MRPDLRLLSVLLALPLALLLACRGGGSAESSPAAESASPAPEQEAIERVLLYPSVEDDLLHAERVRLAPGATPEESMSIVVARYLQGPSGEGRFSPYPDHCTLRALYLLGGARAVVDLGGPVTSGAGAHTEVHRVYGLVDTLVWNFPEVRSVQILVEGREVETLLGHLDLSKPVPPEDRILGLELRRAEGIGGSAGE